MRNFVVLGAVVLTLGVSGAARSQGKADSPSEVLARKTGEFARCITTRGLVRLTLRLDLNKESRVEKVEIESESSLSKSSRKCIERVALELAFTPDLAGKTIEHDLQVLNTRGARTARR